jgi:hypothetical protein
MYTVWSMKKSKYSKPCERPSITTVANIRRGKTLELREFELIIETIFQNVKCLV